MDLGNINLLWSSLLVEELVRNGIDYFCISPGSRSAPLTVAAARHPGVKKLICHDERGAAFHALGYARASGRAAVLICTSGTAAAHYLPALIEATLDRLPMLVLAADRPPELQETGANQTIRQDHLFGRYAKWHFDLPCPTTMVPAAMVLTTLDQAVYQAHSAPAGPVHLNCPFREPLAPVPEPVPEAYLDGLAGWRSGRRAFTVYQPARKVPAPEAVLRLREIVRETRQGMVAVGRLGTVTAQEAVGRLIRALQWPVFADIASGLRCDGTAGPVVPYFDQLLLAGRCRRYRPDTVLHIGDPLTSKRFLQFTESLTDARQIVLNDHPFRQDPGHNVSDRLEGDIAASCAALLEHWEPPPPPPGLADMLDRSARLEAVIDGFVALEQPVSEIAAARLISREIAPDHGLWLASSLPVREMDQYASPRIGRVRIGANRGASGIDGTLAAASGFAAGLERPVTVLIGDLAFLHDLNSLLLVRAGAQPLVIVLINNDGGGIFSFLPIARFSDVFEDYFATPHGLGFKAAAELFGLDYAAPRTHRELVDAYRAALPSPRSTLIEVTTERRANYELHQALERRIVAHLDSL